MNSEQNDLQENLSPGRYNMLAVSPCSSLGSVFSYEFSDPRGDSEDGVSRDSAVSDLESSVDDVMRTSEWGKEARQSWTKQGGEVTQENSVEMDGQLNIGGTKKNGIGGDIFRRFSTPSTPIARLGGGLEICQIPEVIVTQHEFEDEQENPVSNMSSMELLKKRRNKFRRSMSSPDGVLSSISKDARLELANLSIDNEEDYVTLEDVEAFKQSRRKLCKSNSIVSLTSGIERDDRFILPDDGWSYTNCSSTVTCSDRGDVEEGGGRRGSSDIGVWEVGGDRDEKLIERNVSEDVTDKSLKDESSERKRSKSPSWRKLRAVVRWTPFVQSYRSKKYPWVQLAGHSDSFLQGVRQGTVLKKASSWEEACYLALSSDPLAEVTPHFYRRTCKGGIDYLELQCLLSQFSASPNIMDLKMGVRTYLQPEPESVYKLRTDLYEKMVKEDAFAPTEEENKLKAVTKVRYLTWRDDISSTLSLGFRIEGTTIEGSSSRDFKSTKTMDQISVILRKFASKEKTQQQYLNRLLTIRRLCGESNFFTAHELVGSSLLFIHDEDKAGIWMIDFEKTRRSPEGWKPCHDINWEMGNHEDGYLIGLNSVIDLFTMNLNECAVSN